MKQLIIYLLVFFSVGSFDASATNSNNNDRDFDIIVKEVDLDKKDEVNADGAWNGGDSCENEISFLIGNLKRWLNKTRHYKFVSWDDKQQFDNYSKKMADALNLNFSIECFSDKIFVFNKEKTCRNRLSNKHQKGILQCNFERFQTMSMAEKARIIHHEVAGLAGLEQTLDKISQYHFTEQFRHLEFVEDFLSVVPESIHLNFTRINDSYEILNYYVSQGLYFDITGENPSRNKFKENCPATFEARYNFDGTLIGVCPFLPVDNVNFSMVVKFLRRINQLVGERFTLPTTEQLKSVLKSKDYNYPENCSDIPYSWDQVELRSITSRTNQGKIFGLNDGVIEWTKNGSVRNSASHCDGDRLLSGYSFRLVRQN